MHSVNSLNVQFCRLKEEPAVMTNVILLVDVLQLSLESPMNVGYNS
jgi:hypothetical protein